MAIAAVEEENVQLKSQLEQLTVHRDEEVARRDAEITALRNELRAKLADCRPAQEHPEEHQQMMSARSDSLLLEVRSQMEAQEGVINHLRETIRRFQEQTRLIAEVEGENQTLRETVESLHWQLAKQKHRQNPDNTQIRCIESKLDEIDRQYRRRASHLQAILQQLEQCSLSSRSIDDTSWT
ncbi:uncharacterized protein LOC119103921 [Pollicipes pollicipes]|nr:uncharacterized protein LOC119103921 [Pollicipes pollicipes]